MVLGAIDAGAQIQHRGGAARGVGQLAGNGRPVDAIEGFKHIARNGHQCLCAPADTAAAAAPSSTCWMATRMEESSSCGAMPPRPGLPWSPPPLAWTRVALVNKALQGLCAPPARAAHLALIQKPAARRQQKMRGPWSPPINGQCNHVCLFQSTPPVGGESGRGQPFSKNLRL